MSVVHGIINCHACEGGAHYENVHTGCNIAVLTLLQSSFTLVKLSAFASEIPPALQMAFSNSASMLGYPGFLCMPCKHMGDASDSLRQTCSGRSRCNTVEGFTYFDTVLRSLIAIKAGALT